MKNLTPTNNFEAWLLDQLWLAYHEARKCKRRTQDEHNFEINDMQNLIALRNSIVNRTYRPSRSVAFIIRDPVQREVFAAKFVDRVVHHFIFNMCGKWWDNRFCYDSYSCRNNKGTLFGQQRLLHHIRSVHQTTHEPAFVGKFDVQGYFMNLSQKRLYERVLWGLDRQFSDDKNQLYKTLRFLWKQIIFDNPVQGVKIRGTLRDWDGLPDNKSLFHQPKGRGIVIGNLTSQLLSNIYLDQLDRFITLELGYKHYGRYVDDFYIVVPFSQRQQLARDTELIRSKLTSLEQTLHPKKCIKKKAEHGIAFLGVVVYPNNLSPGKRLKTKTKQDFLRFARGDNRSSYETVVSHLSQFHYINGQRFLKQLFDSLGWDYAFENLADKNHQLKLQRRARK